MCFFIGLIRSSVLYAFVLSMFRGTVSVEFAIIYAVFLFGNFLLSKVKKDGLSLDELLTDAIKHDALVPFLGVRSLVLVLLGKYLDSPHEPHAALFLAQGIIEGIWGTLLAVCLVITIIQVV